MKKKFEKGESQISVKIADIMQIYKMFIHTRAENYTAKMQFTLLTISDFYI